MENHCQDCQFLADGTNDKVCIRYPQHFIAIIPKSALSVGRANGPMEGQLLYGFPPINKPDAMWCGEWKQKEEGD